MCTIGQQSFRWPTQLLEGFGDIMILAALLYMEKRGNRKGLLYPVFLLAYGVMRFAIEFLRDTPKTMLFLSEGQWLALCGVAIGIIWIAIFQKTKKNDGSCT